MVPETRYARAPDGAYLAYQTVGEGPIDLVWQFEWIGNVDTIWEHEPSAAWFRGLASFSRLILHDRRGTGASSRNVGYPNLETRVTDLVSVLDAAGSERVVLGGALEGGAPNVLFAATLPERVHSARLVVPGAADHPRSRLPVRRGRGVARGRRGDRREHWGTDAYDEEIC